MAAHKHPRVMVVHHEVRVAVSPHDPRPQSPSWPCFFSLPQPRAPGVPRCARDRCNPHCASLRERPVTQPSATLSGQTAKTSAPAFPEPFFRAQNEPLLDSSDGRAAGEARSGSGRRVFVGLLVAALVACGVAMGANDRAVSALVEGRAAASAAQRTSRTFELRGEDFYTVDRCIMYTYYGKGLLVKDALQADAWRASWKNAGWKPVVLDERHAQIHPRYAALKRTYESLPLGDAPSKRFEAESSLLRYLALAAVGGGYMTEPDVFNVNVPPPPKCDWVPNGGQFTTHDVFIPALVTCDAASCLHVAEAFATAPPEDIKHATGATYLSDVVFFSYFYQYDGVIKTRKSGFNDPTKVRDPPCDENGVEAVPLMFHASPMARARWAKDEADAERARRETGEAERAKRATAKRAADARGAVVDPYAVREGRDGSVASMTRAFRAMHEAPAVHDTRDVAQIMRDRYASLRASTAEKCAPAAFESTREYAETFFPETPSPLQRAYNQEYLCDVSPGETFCDATAEEIEAGFAGIRTSGEKAREASQKTKRASASGNARSSGARGAGEEESDENAATETPRRADASMPRVHSGRVDKRDRLLIKYIDAGA